MCREKTSANPRRCPCNQGEQRNARDRARYNAAKAAAVTTAPTRTKRPARTRVAADTHATATGPTLGAEQETTAPQAPLPPTVADIRTLAAEIGAAAKAPHSPEAQSLIAQHGSLDRAVVALGDQVTERAEMHAGVTAEDVQALQGQASEDADRALAIVRGELGLAARKTTLDSLRAQAKNAPTLNERARLTIEANNAIDEYNALLKDPRFIEAQNAHRRAQTGTHGESGVALAKLRDGYHKAISELRPTGGTLQLTPATKKAAAAALQDGAQFFPSDWITASNEHGPLRAETSTARAHYVDGGLHMTRKQVLRQFKTLKADDFDPIAETNLRYGYEADPDQSSVAPGRTRYIETIYDSKPYIEGQPKPRGRGWEVFTLATTGDQYWRKPSTRMRSMPEHGDAYVRTNKDVRGLADADPYRAITVHELSHRMEASIPEIGRLERDFIVRRTTLADGTRERMVAVNGGKSREAGYADSFPEAYMGRKYDGETSHELLSVGMESLFGGHTGGFVGGGRYERDDECRSFVLGLLASVER